MGFTARAKQLAIPVASCVQAGLRSGHVTDGLSRDELLALVRVLGACADPARLRAVTRVPGDAMPPGPGEEEALRMAHAEFTRLERAGLPVPLDVRAANGRYRSMLWRRRADERAA